MKLDARSRLFIILAGIFTTCLLVGDIIGAKLIQPKVFGLTFTTTVGMVPFPVTFLLTDVLNEFYGKRAARFVTLLGFGMAVLSFMFIYLAGAIPIADMTRDPSWTGVTEASFSNVFLGSLRMIAASMTAYMVAQFTDIGVFNVLKRLSKNRHIWLRATGSTMVSQLIDTVTITIVAWSGVFPVSTMKDMVISSYTMKIMIAVGLTPVIYLAHSLVERGLGIVPVRLDEAGEPVLDAAETLTADPTGVVEPAVTGK
jgi:uncharacterized integral membrane protein (TIGR00697 family)